MSRGAAAHIDDFHIVVGVLRKMDETGVWTDADELTIDYETNTVATVELAMKEVDDLL